MTKQSRRALWALGSIALVLVLVFAGSAVLERVAGSGEAGERARAAVQGFVSALEAGDAAGAAAWTDQEKTAGLALSKTLSGMTKGAKYSAEIASDIAVDEASLAVNVDADVAWAVPGGAVWRYKVVLALNRQEDRWILHWSPSAVHPLLGVGEALAFGVKLSDGSLRDRDGEVVSYAAGSFASTIMSGVREAVTENSGGTGWRVAAVDDSGRVVNSLAEETYEPARSFTVTLDEKVQGAAQSAVDAVGRPAAVVALDATNGEILAITQNQKATDIGPVASSLLFEPGSTFKMVTAAAAVERLALTPDSPVECPGETEIENRVIPNEDKFDLGVVPLRKAFARSCNTSFGRLAAELPGDALSRTALRFGLGADFTIAGITTNTAKVPPAADTAARVESGIGQGKVQVTPFGMALAAATVAADGKVLTPQLIREIPTRVETAQTGLAPDVAAAVKSMMREVVTDGTAVELAPLGEVYGKTGTAQFGDGSSSHGWFVGGRGDVAFAVLVVEGGSSKVAVEVAKRFLSDM